MQLCSLSIVFAIAEFKFYLISHLYYNNNNINNKNTKKKNFSFLLCGYCCSHRRGFSVTNCGRQFRHNFRFFILRSDKLNICQMVRVFLRVCRNQNTIFCCVRKLFGKEKPDIQKSCTGCSESRQGVGVYHF